jgi:hypothetical protein
MIPRLRWPDRFQAKHHSGEYGEFIAAIPIGVSREAVRPHVPGRMPGHLPGGGLR